MRAKVGVLLEVGAIGLWAAFCARPSQDAAIIDAYRGARCVAPTEAEGVSPPTRAWNTDLTTANGRRVQVRGADMVGGRIVVQYRPDGPEVVAANAGDSVYRGDVRISQARTHLLVKARGLAGAVRHEAWLRVQP